MGITQTLRTLLRLINPTPVDHLIDRRQPQKNMATITPTRLTKRNKQMGHVHCDWCGIQHAGEATVKNLQKEFNNYDRAMEQKGE